MRTARIAWVVLALCGWMADSAWSVSLCDFRSPVTSIVDSTLSFAYRYYNDASTSVIDVNSGRVTFDYDQLFDSPNYGFTLAGAAEITLDAFLPTGWLGQGGLTYRYYPFREALFFAYGGLQTSIATGQPQLGLDVVAGVGLGRFSDVTPLAKAVRIERKLLDLEAILDTLPDTTRMNVASVIGRAGEYEAVRDMVADIEGLIESATGVQLDARALLSIEEISISTAHDRRCGWAVQGGVGYQLIDPYGGPQDFVIAGSVDAAFAASPDDQFLLHGSFTGPVDFLDENSISATLSYVYEVTEDSSVTLGYVLQRVKPSGLDASLSHAADLAILFEFAGVDLGLQVSLTREAGDPGWSIDVSLSAGLELL